MSGRILAIDTTAEYGSIALYENAATAACPCEEVLLHAPEGFGGVIFEHIASLLQRAGLRLEEVDGFAAASGPGSFTGVRIGLACVKGLAEATGKAAFGVSNLAALARFGATDRRVPVIDARRGEVYAAVYDAHGAAIVEEAVCPLAAFVSRLPEGVVEIISQSDVEGRVVKAPLGIAGMMARIAGERLAAGEAGDPAGLDANYVRRSDAELLFKPW